MENFENLQEIAKLLRYYVLTSTTEAGSGHPSSCLSSVELMTNLFFNNHFKYDIKNPDNSNNDRLIFSKGHAAPLLYSMWAVAGAIKAEELKTLRKFKSPLEGHPTKQFVYGEAATGSLGQGLSIGLGMALNAKLENLDYKTYVLLGDGELTEGSNWEAIELARHYKLDNLVLIIDVNRLEQTEETLHGWDLDIIERKFEAFGWNTCIINNGHDFESIENAYSQIEGNKDAPIVFIAETVKGKGVALMEDKIEWHGKALNKEQLRGALMEMGKVKEVTVELKLPNQVQSKDIDTGSSILDSQESSIKNLVSYDNSEKISTRRAYGNALLNLGKNDRVLVLDAGTQNSTFAQTFEKAYKEKFLPMYIAEQNMVGTALGLSLRGKIPFISTFSVFFSRAYDQIRMTQYSNSNIKFVGSHSGVSIGEDGGSQMGLSDLAIFRTIPEIVIFYPSDAVSADRLTNLAAQHKGNVYIRTTRMDTPVLYSEKDKFEIGGSKIVRESVYDQVTVVGAGITLHEALKAYEELKKENIFIRVVDLYSIKPIDYQTISKCMRETKALLVVEDHVMEGGIGEAVRSMVANTRVPIYNLCVNKIPMSGTPEELLKYEEIDYTAIIKKVKSLVQ